MKIDDDDFKGYDEWRYIYEIFYAHKALRFLFMHPMCVIDIIHDEGDDKEWNRFHNVIKNYKEITFEKHIEGKRWGNIWERPGEECFK